MEENKTTKNLVATEDLKPILNVLKTEDAQTIIALKEELTDNWTKKQIFRTETEMRISVLNDGKHPTAASKYWQSVREQSAHFDGMMSLSFNLRRNEVKRLKLERKMQKAIDAGDDLKQIEIQIDLDENLFGKANMEQTAKDRVREIATWSKIKAELDDGSFDSKNVNTHQADSYGLALKNRVDTLGNSSSQAEVLNALGPLKTLERLKTPQGQLQNFKDAKLQLQVSNDKDKE